MLKFLYFADAESDGRDCICMPVSLLRAMKIDTESDGVTFEFKDTGDGIGAEVTLKASTTRNKAQDVIDAVANAIRTSKKPFIVVADTLSKEFIHTDLLNIELPGDLSIQ
jgi:GTP cyclohydrolase II